MAVSDALEKVLLTLAEQDNKNADNLLKTQEQLVETLKMVGDLADRVAKLERGYE